MQYHIIIEKLIFLEFSPIGSRNFKVDEEITRNAPNIEQNIFGDSPYYLSFFWKYDVFLVFLLKDSL